MHHGSRRAVVVVGLLAASFWGGGSASAASGNPSADCVEGWTAPPPGSELYDEGLDLIRGQMGIQGDFDVDEMRYFLGPDVPWIIEPHFDVVRRWYVKASLVDDPEFRGRWLLEYRAPDRRGISAAAPYDTVGYQSPDWRGFAGDGPPRHVPGLPGEWPGVEYDFVTGEGDSGNPGLPAEVEGCLDEVTAEPPGTLPSSGSSQAGGMALAASLFVAVGGGLVVASRRPRWLAPRTREVRTTRR
jgi:hypothetical protein